MHGSFGRILIVDLEARNWREEALDPTVPETALGGKGLASRLLYDLNPPGVDPFEPDNRLIFAAGPAAGSAVWGSSRYGVFTKSPQTGFYTESYSGGRTPEAVDATGYDAIVLAGACQDPTVLVITPDGVRFHPAGELWGLDTYRAETEALARFAPSGHAKKGAVVIGPAGENLCRFAVIENDRWRSAGRTGAGAVMGAKKIKAIVFAGDRRRIPADPEGIRVQASRMAALAKDHPGVKAYRTMGTPQMVKIINQVHAFPTRYWSEGVYDRWEAISAQALHDRCQVRPRACLKCFMACGRLTTVLEGRHAGLTIEGPEYETIYAFGGLCCIDRIEEIAWLNDICDRLGLDTISAGNLCGLAIEAARRGRIDAPLDYGRVDALADLLHQIAARQGPGEVLSQGIRAAAKAWDLEDLAIHVKGLEPAGYDPRALKGMGLAYGTSDRGACHLRTTFYKPEIAGMIAPDAVEGKAELLIDFEDRLTLFDCLILCRFFRDLYDWEELTRLVNLLTGLGLDRDGMRRRAAAVTDLVRSFNVREGLRPEDDRLPPRLHREALGTGETLPEADMEFMLADYYRLRGWDDRGNPPV
ncbi:MAG: aldehyde ferredoxin oxidoreductase family protein [Proteobacteria bacterium]|nr:aldehyde ferredoxin oxidoreductase family protein [Pseudomonadota bacterium]